MVSDWSYLDPMTAVLNRKAAFPRFEAKLAEAYAAGRPVSVLMLDLDHLKRFCDVRSLHSGDKAIRVVANVLADLWTQDVLPCRMGGEEFVVLLHGLAREPALAFAEACRAAIAAKRFPDFQTGELVSLTASLGVASAQPPDDTLIDLLRRADDALNDAKNGGRNRVAFR